MELHDRAALISIDVQQGFDDPSWGPRNNPHMEAHGRQLLTAWRRAGRPLVIVRNDSPSPTSPLRPGQPGNALKPGFEPLAGEPLLIKTVNSAFIGTDLEARLHEAGVRQVVLFGIATDMCVSTTARMAANLGFDLVVVGDACHTWAQRAPDGTLFDADTMHRVHLATLATEFGRVVDTADVLQALMARAA
jgi:nicotinamidase-related amidase